VRAPRVGCVSATDPTRIVRWLAERGIVLAAEGEALRVRSRAPLLPAVRERIRANKPALLVHLTRPAVARPEAAPGDAHRAGDQNTRGPVPKVPNIEHPSDGPASNIRDFRDGVAENFAPTCAVRVTDAAGLIAVATSVGSVQRIGLDLETTGLNPARNRIRLLSLATGADTFVIDLFTLADSVRALAPLFAVLAEKEIVGHNIVSFDLPFLARLGFVPAKVFDTALASRVVYAGERADHDLASVVERELGEPLDKGEQDSDWSRPVLTPAQLAYAAADVAVLLRSSQKRCPGEKAVRGGRGRGLWFARLSEKRRCGAHTTDRELLSCSRGACGRGSPRTVTAGCL
jgi:hypothetical protein